MSLLKNINVFIILYEILLSLICDQIWENRRIAGWVKIDFLPEKISTKFNYCLHKTISAILSPVLMLRL